MNIPFEGHPQVLAIYPGIRPRLQHPDVTSEPLAEGANDADAHGLSIYGSVLEDGGRYRMWCQAWPRDWDFKDVCTVACLESDDGLEWRRPEHGLVEACGSKANCLCDLPMHSPSVFVDPAAPADARYRAVGYVDPLNVKKRKGHDRHKPVRKGYFLAHSADGLRWELDTDEPVWEGMDVVTSCWDPRRGCAIVMLKRNPVVGGMNRRCFWQAEVRDGRPGPVVPALVPDELDDARARSQGFHSADYYGLGMMPVGDATVGFLWNFLHQFPLHVEPDASFACGNEGGLDLSLVHQLQRGGAWRHLPGRPAWLRREDRPAWASGAVYTAANTLDVDGRTRLYFCGSKDLHGFAGRGEDLGAFYDAHLQNGGWVKIGLLSWPQGRLYGLETELLSEMHLAPAEALRDAADGPAAPAGEGRAAVHVSVRKGGCVRAALCEKAGVDRILPGYSFEDCEAIGEGDHEGEIRWRGRALLPQVDPQNLVLRLELRGATLWGFEFRMG